MLNKYLAYTNDVFHFRMRVRLALADLGASKPLSSGQYSIWPLNFGAVFLTMVGETAKYNNAQRKYVVPSRHGFELPGTF